MEQTPSLEYRLSTLIANYLTHVQEGGGLPPVLSIGIGLEMAGRQRPCVVCHIDTLEFPHPKLVEASGIMILHTHADETPVLTEAIWTTALRSALCNTGTLFAWIATLPQSMREGWDLRRVRLTRCESEINREERTRTHTTRFTLSVQASELTSGS